MTIRTRIRSIRTTDSFWRYGSNLGPTLQHFVRANKKGKGVAEHVVNRLNSDGVAVMELGDLLGADMTTELYAGIDRLTKSKRAEIDHLKTNVDQDLTLGQKTFNLELLGWEPEFDPGSVFARVGLDETLLAIANGYLRMTAQLRYYNVWYTAASSSVSRESQLWHFDREDNYILKVFVYLDDVDEGSGPFTYAPGTHRKGVHRSLKPKFMMEGNVRRTTDEQMSEAYPRGDWKVCTGKKGTVIFADTRGYHKGGEARTGDRLMFTCMYTSPASQSKDLLRFPVELDMAELSPEQIRALRIPRK